MLFTASNALRMHERQTIRTLTWRVVTMAETDRLMSENDKSGPSTSKMSTYDVEDEGRGSELDSSSDC